MIKRSQELKLAARSMTEAAFRLIEPENEAVNSVRSVGQAVRTEVNALNDGIERAMARAGELETLVHNEVSSLENSYSDNELRMRGLVEELASERESIVGHTERVRSSITGASETLKEDLGFSAQQISDNVAEAQLKFSEALGKTNEEMKASMGMAGNTLLTELNEKSTEIGVQIEMAGGGIVERLVATGISTTSAIEDVQASLSFASESLADVLNSKGTEISDRIDNSSNILVDRISATGTATSSALEIKSNELAERINFLSDDLQTKVSEQFSTIDQDLHTRGNALVERMGQRTAELAETLDTSAQAVDKDLERTHQQLWPNPNWPG